MALIQRTVYIREEDIDTFNKIQNKAKWFHERLVLPTPKHDSLPNREHEKITSGEPQIVKNAEWGA